MLIDIFTKLIISGIVFIGLFIWNTNFLSDEVILNKKKLIFSFILSCLGSGMILLV